MLVLVVLALVGQTTEVERLRYRAPDDCPDAQVFVDAVRRRAPNGSLDQPSTQTLHVEVRTSSVGAYLGTLVVREDGHAFTPRRVSGVDCTEVTSALALITALVLRTPPRAPPPPPDSSPPFGNVQPVLRMQPSRVTPGESSRWAVAVGVAGDAGLLPGLTWSAPIEVAYGTVDRAVEGPVVRAALRWGRGSTGDDFARFTAVGLGLEVCPWSYASGPWKLEPCGAATVGALFASGAGLVAAQEAARGFASVGARARGQWFLSPWVFVEAALRVEAVLVRDRFAARPDTTLHRASPVSGGLQSGVGVIFW